MEKKDTKPKRRDYTTESIAKLLEGYIAVEKSLWDYIAVGAHLRYSRRGNEAVTDRFRSGGFLRNRYVNERGVKMLMLETSRGGKQGTFGYSAWPVAYEDVDQLWKKYSEDATIEIHLINNSLAKKNAQIENLLARVAALESALKGRPRT